jgi:limonene-1,2-epoxide hydrolase
MGVEQEAAVRAFIADLEGEQLDAAQIERAVNRMTPDAEWHVVAWHDPFVGHDAIRAEFLREAQLFRDLRIEILAIGSIGGIVFTERIDSMLLRGKPLRAHIAGVFEVDADGKIAAWRDYGDTREVSAQMNADGGGAGTPDKTGAP